ncbi:unnamed protein product [Caenorhabditis auriculariae]|uniref:Uncharacterized protein n=1 Tax=Caenorhabditis auriculariae TaxID=2777116 RepID=A0A8S1GT10_9PELO|nr:unnamed protein product [Caenorhabditis auriculariae]
MNSASPAQSPVRTAPQSFDSLANAPLRIEDRRPLDRSTRSRRSLNFSALSPVRASQELESLENAPLRKNIRRSSEITTRNRRSLNFNLLSPVRASPASQEIESLANAPLRKNIRRSLDTTTRTRRSLDFFALSPVRAAPVPQNFDSLANAPVRKNMRRSLDTTSRSRRSLNFSINLAPAQEASEAPAQVPKTPIRSELTPEVVQGLSWAPIRNNRQTRRSLDSARPAVLVFSLENPSQDA